MAIMKVAGGTVVAALFVPGKGVSLGTPAHGAGHAKVISFAKAKIPFPWKLMESRTIKENKAGPLYHAEDVAMLYAIEGGNVKGGGQFPTGSKIVSWARSYDTRPKG